MFSLIMVSLDQNQSQIYTFQDILQKNYRELYFKNAPKSLFLHEGVSL